MLLGRKNEQRHTDIVILYNYVHNLPKASSHIHQATANSDYGATQPRDIHLDGLSC